MKLVAAVVGVALAGCAADALDESSAEQATTVCGGGPVVQGMDVSVYETSIDFPTAKAAGIDFAFIRATDGLQYIDPQFATYWPAAKAAGVMRGAYQFFRPDEDPIAQADLLLQMAPYAPGDLPPVIDVETTDGLTPAEVAAAVQQWVAHVQAAIGRPPIIYAGYYSWQDDVGGANLTTSPLWHAQYTDEPCPNIPVPWTSWSFWQYSSTGTVPSVEGETTDLDVFDGTLAELQAFAAAPPPPCGVIPAAGGVIDNDSPCFSAGGPSSTLRAVDDAGFGSDLVWTKTTSDTVEGNFAQWDLAFAEAGQYQVDVYTDAAYAQATTASYQITAAGAPLQRVSLDQSAADGWQPLGSFAFAAGSGQWIALGDDTGTAGQQLVFDALRAVRLDAPSGSDAGSGSADGSAGSGSGSDRSGPIASADGGGCAAGGGGGGELSLLPLVALVWPRRGAVRRGRA